MTIKENLKQAVEEDLKVYGDNAYLMWEIWMLSDGKYEGYKNNEELLRDIDEPFIDKTRILRKKYPPKNEALPPR